MRHKVIIQADPDRLENALSFCRERLGHRGTGNHWWWRPRYAFKDKIFVFLFNEGEDALAFSLAHESIQI